MTSTQDEIKEASDDTLTRLFEFLEESNVPVDHLERLRKLSDDHECEEVLERAENIGYCMPYMKHEELIRLLTVGWRHECAYKQILRKKAFRFCLRLESDNKTDSEELEEARKKRDLIDHSCAVANLKLCKLQLVLRSYEEEEEANEQRNPYGDEEEKDHHNHDGIDNDDEEESKAGGRY
uniref:Uncharacterized protein n=1 Tax=Aureoumbra lagunensis TaxID=44058 RepID=A0A7S3K4K2_9STRA|mmetsp:Transcript_9674/g.13429  ORF Transcript_9674/g.13429 Transcript_9674/m.13429 type:complete len:180 (+) Transcript_9674:39-578(+)